MKRFLTLTILCAFAVSCAFAQTLFAADTNKAKKENNKTAAAITKKKDTKTPVHGFSPDNLSIEHHIGQTIMTRVITGEQDYYKDAIEKGHLTGVFLKTAAGYLDPVEERVFPPSEHAAYIASQRAKTLKTIADLRKWEKNSPHAIPLIIAVDYEGGPVTSTMYLGLKQPPSNMLLAATGDVKLIERMYAVMAKEVKSLGAQIAFTPVLDVNTNPQNPIIGARSFGSKSENIGAYGVAAVKGLQGEGVISFVKHFPGHGDVDLDTHEGGAVTDLPIDELSKHINAFTPAIKAGVDGVMVCHVTYPALDKDNTASFSKKITTGLLRDKLAFKGVIATDDLGMRGAAAGNTTVQIVSKALNAGGDLLLLSGDEREVETASHYPSVAVNYIEGLIGTEIDEARVKNSARKIIDMKQKTGLFAGPVKQSYNEKEFTKTAQEAADKGVTLVRNSEGAIPINKKDKVCSVFFGDSIFGAQFENFNKRLKKGGIKAKSYIAAMTPTEEDAAKVRACADSADIVVIGSMQRYKADEKQKMLIEEVLKTAPESILISLLSPYDITLYPQAETVLAVYGPTLETMGTAADIMLGRKPALGALPVDLE